MDAYIYIIFIGIAPCLAILISFIWKKEVRNHPVDLIAFISLALLAYILTAIVVFILDPSYWNADPSSNPVITYGVRVAGVICTVRSK